MIHIPIEYAPYQVSIRMLPNDDEFGLGLFSAGVLISNSTILTAAHNLVYRDTDHNVMVLDPECLRIVGGNPSSLNDSAAFITNAVRVVIHELYDVSPFSYEHDIAIIHLANVIPLGREDIGILRLPSGPYEAGAECTLTAWDIDFPV